MRCLLACLAVCLTPALASAEQRAAPSPALAPDRAAAVQPLAPEDYRIRPPWLDRAARCLAASAEEPPEGCALEPAIVGVHPDGRVALIYVQSMPLCRADRSLTLQIRDAQSVETDVAVGQGPAFHTTAWRWIDGLRAEGFVAAPDLITATVEQKAGERRHTPLAVLGASGGWIVDAVQGPKSAQVRLIDPDRKAAQALGELVYFNLKCSPEDRAAGRCQTTTFPSLLQVVRAPVGDALLVLATMQTGAACGVEFVELRRWPIPAGALPTEKPQPQRQPAGDVAVVMNASGLFAVPLDGGAPKALPAPKGHRSWCHTDPRADGVWVLEGADEQPATLHFVDLRTGESRPVVRDVPAAVDDIVIDYGAAGRIGGHDRVELRVGLAVRMGPKPAVEPEVGCDGDAAWYCYAEDDIGKPGAPLVPEYEAQRAAVAQLKPVDGGWLASIAQRGAQRPLWREVEPAMALPAVEISNAGCQAEPDDCGQARPVPGTPYWRVIVANDRGDFFYQDEQLFDPRSREFFGIEAPAKRSKTPLTGGQSVEGLLISPSGQGFAGGGRVGRFDGKPVQAVADARVCGWTGPAVRITGPRE